jgi:Double zinc ribbon
MAWIFVLLASLIVSYLVGEYAHRKGLSREGYFVLSLLLSPLVGFIVAAVTEPNREKIARISGSLKRSPDCAEYVQREARVCRFCKHTFPPNAPLPDFVQSAWGINDTSSTDVCPSCGSRIPDGANFCPACREKWMRQGPTRQ